EADAINRVGMAVLQVHDLFPRADLEDLELALDGGLAAGDGEELAVEREGDGDDGIGEAGDALAKLAGEDVPDGDLLKAAGDEPFAVGRVSHGIDERHVGG